MDNSQRPTGMRHAVIAGVLASAFVIVFVEPLLIWIWNIISESTLAIWDDFIDKAYENASLGVRSTSSVFILILLAGVLSGLVVATLLRPLIKSLLVRSLSSSESLEATRTKAMRILYVARTVEFLAGALIVYHLFRLVLLAFVDFQLNSSFDRRLTVLASVINEQQEEDLRAQWALMTSRADYHKIRARMEILARENAIVLPKDLVSP